MARCCSETSSTSGSGSCSGSCIFTGATGAAVVGLGFWRHSRGCRRRRGFLFGHHHFRNCLDGLLLLRLLYLHRRHRSGRGWFGCWRHSRGCRRRRRFLFGHHHFGNCLDGLLLLRDEFYFRLDLRLDHDYRLTHIQLITGFWQRCRWCLRHGCSHGWLRFWRCSRWSHGSCGYHGGRGGLLQPARGPARAPPASQGGHWSAQIRPAAVGSTGATATNLGWHEFQQALPKVPQAGRGR